MGNVATNCKTFCFAVKNKACTTKKKSFNFSIFNHHLKILNFKIQSEIFILAKNAFPLKKKKNM